MKKKKKDIVIISIIFGIAVVLLGVNYFLFSNKGDNYCEIYVDGNLVDTVELNHNRQFSIDEMPNIIFEIKDHSIAFIKSDCPDKVCINSGYLRYNGQSTSCLPNRTTIRIYARVTDTEDADMVVIHDH